MLSYYRPYGRPIKYHIHTSGSTKDRTFPDIRAKLLVKCSKVLNHANFIHSRQICREFRFEPIYNLKVVAFSL